MRVVFIGGTSGIGLAAARRAVDAGWDVVVASRNPERADLTAEKMTLDVTDAAAVRTFFDDVGTVDHLVSSTVARAGGPAKKLDLDAARRAFEVKLWGPFEAVQAADVRRSVVLLSGVAASTPSSGAAATAAVNGAVEALVRVLAVELAPVRVNAVSPASSTPPPGSTSPTTTGGGCSGTSWTLYRSGASARPTTSRTRSGTRSRTSSSRAPSCT